MWLCQSAALAVCGFSRRKASSSWSMDLPIEVGVSLIGTALRFARESNWKSSVSILRFELRRFARQNALPPQVSSACRPRLAHPRRDGLGHDRVEKNDHHTPREKTHNQTANPDCNPFRLKAADLHDDKPSSRASWKICNDRQKLTLELHSLTP